MITYSPINFSERHTYDNYMLWFGACAPTYLLVWAPNLEDALDECIDWIKEHAPGLLCNDTVNEAYQYKLAECLELGIEQETAEERAIEYAETDVTTGGNCGDYIMSDDWGIRGENLTAAELKNLRK